MNAWQDIWDMLRQGAIVYGDEDLGVLVTFNGSSTFNIWVPDGRGHYDNTDVWTSGDIMKHATVDELHDYCQAHFEEARRLDLARKDQDEYEVGDRVKVIETGETGTIIEVDGSEPMYYVDLDDRTGEYTAEYFYSEDVELIVEE